LREANRLLSDQGAPPLVDIGGLVNEEAVAGAAAKRASAIEYRTSDVPQPVVAGVKKVATSSVASPSLKPQPGKGSGQANARAQTPTGTFLTGGGWEGEDDELAKVCVRITRKTIYEHQSQFIYPLRIIRRILPLDTSWMPGCKRCRSCWE
jgi:hypothetical protein